MRTGSASAIAVLLLVAAPYASAQVAITGARPAPPKPSPAAPAPAPADTSATTPPRRGGGDSDTMLADVADEFKFAVGAVVIVLPKVGATAFGTAWAFEPNRFATNGHVVNVMAELAEKFPGAPFYVAINQRPDKRLQITKAAKHPLYGKDQVRFDGKTAELGAYDIGILSTSEPSPAHFKVASQSQLRALRSGSRVAYLGFPMESLLQGNLDAQMPIATMQSGIVTSLSDYFLSDSGYEQNRLIRHNLPSAGGASGSPIFTPEGVVVAIHFAGNHILGITADGKGVERKANATLINFAERIDSLADVPRP